MNKLSENTKTFKTFKISACKKLKSGVKKRRYTSSIRRMNIWLKSEPFEEVIIRCVWGWGDNKKRAVTLDDALWFVRVNWEDYCYYAKLERS